VSWRGRSYARLAIDLTWVFLSPFAALFIRQNFVVSVARLYDVVPYMLMCVFSAAIVFSLAGLHRTLWRYTSLPDVLRLVSAVTIAVLLAVLGAFTVTRLEGVARSLPLIQWFLLLFCMVGTRVAVRLRGERQRRGKFDRSPQPKQHVLVVGVNDLTELYLRSVVEFAPASFAIVGILTPESQLQGRLFRLHKILGEPDDVQQVLAQLEVHGVIVERIVVTLPFENLSRNAREALQVVERSSSIKVDWLIESLGLCDWSVPDAQNAGTAVPETKVAELSSSMEKELISLGRYHHMKRMIDATAALLVLIALTPVFALTALLVASDVGFPLVFWQKRPGRYGHLFKVFKFRTMAVAAHDAEGNRIPDELRSSTVGRFLRRFWLDELPQLYNILVGEMSFVGPRPLLSIDQPTGQNARLLVRPGLTGLAQVNGGRDISAEHKAALDVWYISNASLSLDIKILLRTLGNMLSGGQPQALHEGVKGTRIRAAVESGPTLLPELSRLSARSAQDTA
jgi:lipopolysaccharide/colanic/teichoic acid biosynthesis glycosyltransferase